MEQVLLLLDKWFHVPPFKCALYTVLDSCSGYLSSGKENFSRKTFWLLASGLLLRSSYSDRQSVWGFFPV